MRQVAPRPAVGADDEDHQDLRGHRFEEPDGAELLRRGVEDQQQAGEGQQVEDRRQRPHHAGKAHQGAHVPDLRLRCRLGPHGVEGNADLGEVVEKIVEQDLRRQHRQERQEQRRHRHRQHVAEVRARTHAHVFQDVGEGPPALLDAVGDDLEIGGQQDHVGGGLRHAGGAVDRQADVGHLERRRVVDAVAQEAHHLAASTAAP